MYISYVIITNGPYCGTRMSPFRMCHIVDSICHHSECPILWSTYVTIPNVPYCRSHMSSFRMSHILRFLEIVSGHLSYDVRWMCKVVFARVYQMLSVIQVASLWWVHISPSCASEHTFQAWFVFQGWLISAFSLLSSCHALSVVQASSRVDNLLK